MNFKFKSDAIDYCCEQLKGHDNWAYLHTLTEDEKKKLNGATVVVFWDREEVDGFKLIKRCRGTV